ncbi:MCE family protein [Streptomyces sp. LP05-1]|uniref:MCE family protein n=1 Tax=Streptomyces pyxinae TaxID=2970734 RepID=A0ABT2CF70_9ACTN|nr:MlaD family protein [Streptomyces sp. LP05-1]MCS0635732.1 MCE family protein [Streptomyces sp. LP05-1]
MITRLTHLKNIAFLLLGAVVLAYIGLHYADLGRWAGASGTYTVLVELDRTGGLFDGSNVTYRGVDVGRVRTVRLTDDGVEAELAIDTATPRIPADLTAKVADLSAVGEDYIDLAPRTGHGPYLRDGSRVPRTDTTTPAPITDLLASVTSLSASVPAEELRTTVDELGRAFSHQGQNLQVLLDSGSRFLEAADTAFPATRELLVDSRTVLATQADSSRALAAFADGAQQIARTLKTSDADLRRLVGAAPEAAEQVTALLKDTDPGLSVLLANLTTTSELFVTRQDGVRELMVRLPRVAAKGATAITGAGVRLGLVTTFFQPLPCTAGYGGTPHRNGLDTSTGRVNTSAACTASPGSGQNVRGSANAPRGGVPAPAGPGPLGSAAPLPRQGAAHPGPSDLGGLLGLAEGGGR